MTERNILKKETLIVERLPSFFCYRVWNYVVEHTFDTWDKFSSYVKEFNLMEQYNFVSYSEETQKLLDNLKKAVYEDDI